MKISKVLLMPMVATVFVTGAVLAQSSSQGMGRYTLPTPMSGTLESATVPGEEMQTLTYPASWNNPLPDGWIDPANPRPPFGENYEPIDKPLGTGPYKAILSTEPGAEELVAYYPADLAALGNTRLPVLVWGHGGCSRVGNRHRSLLTDIASYGYLVVAGGAMEINDGANETISIRSNNGLHNPLAEQLPDSYMRSNTLNLEYAALLSSGIDWAIAENQREGSKFFNRLDTDNIAVMGHSCGGGAASSFGSDPRVKTVGLWNSIGSAELAAGITKPVLIAPGDPRFDVFYWIGNETYKIVRKTSTPVAFIWRTNMTHLGTFRTLNGGLESPVVRAWLDYQLKGDREAATMFVGDDCVLCNTPGWQVESRNLN